MIIAQWRADKYNWHNDYDPETSVTVTVTPDYANSFTMTRTKETSVAQTIAVSSYIAGYFCEWMNSSRPTGQILIEYKRGPRE